MVPPATDDVDLVAAIRRAVAVVLGEPSTAAIREVLPAEALEQVLPLLDASRGEVEGLRRREHELSALYASARELVGLSDADAVLTRLVDRAHDMLGADLTYLSEFDQDTRELRVRTTRGAVSASFRNLVVPPGRGLVGEIADSGVPRAVSRYDDYAAELHDPGVDDAVAAEGIVSLLGVPLHAETGMLGVLFVAMRQERQFHPEQIALLSALADHASVVLQAAAAVRTVQRSEQQARSAVDELSGYLGERERANIVHQHLVKAVLAGGGFTPVARTLENTLGRAVCIVDERGRVRAQAGNAERLPALWSSSAGRAAVAQSRSSGHAATALDRDDAAGGDAEVVVAALAAGRHLFGAIIVAVERGDGLSAVDRRILERAAQVGALLALSEEAQTEAAHRQQIDLVAELLSAAPDVHADVAARARRLGVEVDELGTLVAIDVPADRRADAVKLLTRRVGGLGLAGERDGIAVLLTADPARPESVRSELEKHLGVAVRAVRAVGATTGAGIPAAFDQARRGLRLLAAIGVDSGTATTEELLPYAAIFDTDQRGLDDFLESTIGAVRRHDAKAGTELLPTLSAFVRSGASPTRTARELTFHPNTIVQRLERLDQVLGPGWREDEALFRIGLAVRLDDLRRRLTRAEPR